jgi:hypothetical protein
MYRPILFSSLAILGTGLAFAAPDLLSLGDIETRLTAQGIKIHEIELKDLIVEVEGRDANGRKVELLIDRRTGETLSQKLDR